MQRSIVTALLVAGFFANAACLASDVYYKCANCGSYHVLNNTNQRTVQRTVQPTNEVRISPSTTASRVVPASAATWSGTTRAVPASAPTQSGTTMRAQGSQTPWRFDKANNWPRRIDPRAQAWAQQEANRLAQRGYSGYLRNGHPGGNNPHARVTGTGTTFPGSTLIHTCEGDPGMTLVAEAAAVGRDGRIYGVRSWR